MESIELHHQRMIVGLFLRYVTQAMCGKGIGLAFLRITHLVSYERESIALHGI